MATEYTGAGGVRQVYGPRKSPVTNPIPVPAACYIGGVEKEVVVRFAFDGVIAPSASSKDDAVEHVIPANSLILSARMYQEAAWVGGTSVAIDTRAVADGSVVTADALITAAAGATANLGVNTWLVGAGAKVGATVGTADVKLGSTIVGTFTAGRSKLVVRYLTSESH